FLKPGGIMIPYRCITKIAAVSLPAKLRERPRFSELTQGYVDNIFRNAGHPFDLRLCIKDLPPESIASNPGTFESLDFSDAVNPSQRNSFTLTIDRDCNIDGFLLWINLYPAPDRFIDVISGEHSWLPVFFPVFYPGLDVRAGDRIEAESFVIDNGSM